MIPARMMCDLGHMCVAFVLCSMHVCICSIHVWGSSVVQVFFCLQRKTVHLLVSIDKYQTYTPPSYTTMHTMHTSTHHRIHHHTPCGGASLPFSSFFLQAPHAPHHIHDLSQCRRRSHAGRTTCSAQKNNPSTKQNWFQSFVASLVSSTPTQKPPPQQVASGV